MADSKTLTLDSILDDVIYPADKYMKVGKYLPMEVDKTKQQARQALTQLFKDKMMELVGEDDVEKDFRHTVYNAKIAGRNDLRQSLRKSIGEESL